MEFHQTWSARDTIMEGYYRSTFLFPFCSYLLVQPELNAKQNGCDWVISNSIMKTFPSLHLLYLGVNLINRILAPY